MAELSESDRFAAWRDYMKDNRDAIAVTKQDLRAAIDAADTWVDANGVSYNLSLPIEARSNLTNKQKALLLVFVITKRFGVL